MRLQGLIPNCERRTLSLFCTPPIGDLSNHSVLAESFASGNQMSGRALNCSSLFQIACAVLLQLLKRVRVEEKDARFVRFEFRIVEKILVLVVNKKQQVARMHPCLLKSFDKK